MGAVLLNRYNDVPASLRSREIALVGNGMYFGDADGVPQELTAAAITRAILIEKIGYEPADADALADVAKSGQYADLTGKPDLSAFDEVESYASQSQFPPNGDDGILLYLAADTGLMYRHDGSTYVEVTGKAPIWGEIAGSIEDQPDLRQALASKLEEVPAKYLTETQGDNRYLQSLPEHSHTAQSVEYGSGTVADQLESLGEGVWSEAELLTLFGAFIVAGENIKITPNDAGTAVTIKATVSSSGTSGLTGEDVREIAANAFTGTNGITVTEDDSADTITLSFDVSKSSLSGRLNNIESTLGDKADESALAPVAKSGQYGDLSGKPDLSAFDEVEAYGSQSNFPPNGDADVLLYIASDTGAVYRYDGSNYVEVSGKAPIWGDITGSIADQTDLRNWLDGKANKSDTRDDAGIRDLLEATFEGGASIDVTRSGSTITIAFTGEAGGGLDAQGVRDTVAAYILTRGRIGASIKNNGDNLEFHVQDPDIIDVTGLQDALDAKADDSALAPVSKSGNYGDLSGKPDLSAFDEVEAYGSRAQFPPNGDADVLLYIASDTGLVYRYDGSSYIEVSGKAPIWGDVTGSLADQTDLQNVLDAKANKSDTRNDGGIRDLMHTTLKAGTSINITRSGNAIVIDYSGDSGGGVTEERARDVIGNALRGIDGITVNHEDGSDTITLGYAPAGTGIDVDAIMADSPTALYMLDDGGGTTAADTSGNGRDATYEGAVEHDAAPVAAGTTASIRLPGGTDSAPRVLLGQGDHLLGNAAGNTIEAWFNADGVQRSQVIAEAGASGNGLSLQIANGQLHAVTSEAPNTISVPIEAGTDYHAGGVWATDDYIALYLQGVEEDSVPPGSANTLDAGSNASAIGAVASGMVQLDGTEAEDGTLGFAGRLGPVAFYDKPLSADRIAAHVKGDSAGLSPADVRTLMRDYIITRGRIGASVKNNGDNLEFHVQDPSISQVTGLSDALNGLSESQQNHKNDTENPHGVGADDITWSDPLSQGRGGTLDEVFNDLYQTKITQQDLFALHTETIPCTATPGPFDGQVTIEWDHPSYGQADLYVVLGAPSSFPPNEGGAHLNFLELRGSNNTSYRHEPPPSNLTWRYRVVAVGGPYASATPQ